LRAQSYGVELTTATHVKCRLNPDRRISLTEEQSWAVVYEITAPGCAWSVQTYWAVFSTGVTTV